MMYQVEYAATYWVEATDEDDAIEIHASLPDGDWVAFPERGENE